MCVRTAAGIGLRVTILMLMVSWGIQLTHAAGREIPAADNLAEIAQRSLQQSIPVIVFVSRDACPYCRTLRGEILEPMLAADKFENQAILVEVSLDRVGPLTGFENRPMTAKDFAAFYRAQITPTLLFLDSAGREISKRRIGISNLELYGHYLQKSMEEALLTIQMAGPGE